MRVGIVGVDEVIGGEGVRADGGTTGVQGFLQEEGGGEEEGGGVGVEEEGRGVGRRERQEGEEEEGRKGRG